MKTITITAKDLKAHNIPSSDSGMLIDTLAYAAKQWTSNDLWENNIDYQPFKPYQFPYEADLFEATKTADALYALAQSLKVSLNANWKRIAEEQKLQAGACVALNNPEEWSVLLEVYTQALEDNQTDGISPAYNKALQQEQAAYSDDQYREWLNGDHRNYRGVVYEIAKYFTDERDGDYDKNADAYTFTLNDADIEKYKDAGYRSNQLKRALLDDILSSTNSRISEHRIEQEKRRIERERLSAYKAEQKKREEAERVAMLKAKTLN